MKIEMNNKRILITGAAGFIGACKTDFKRDALRLCGGN